MNERQKNIIAIIVPVIVILFSLAIAFPADFSKYWSGRDFKNIFYALSIGVIIITIFELFWFRDRKNIISSKILKVREVKSPLKEQQVPKRCTECGSYDTKSSVLEDGSLGDWLWCPHCQIFIRENKMPRSAGYNKFMRIMIYSAGFVSYIIIIAVIVELILGKRLDIKKISPLQIITIMGLVFFWGAIKLYLDKHFPIYLEKSFAPSKECPKCKQHVVFQAYIENGGIGDWCPKCKESLKKMRGEL